MKKLQELKEKTKEWCEQNKTKVALAGGTILGIGATIGVSVLYDKYFLTDRIESYCHTGKDSKDGTELVGIVLRRKDIFKKEHPFGDIYWTKDKAKDVGNIILQAANAAPGELDNLPEWNVKM